MTPKPINKKELNIQQHLKLLLSEFDLKTEQLERHLSTTIDNCGPFLKISDDFNKNNSCLLGKLHREVQGKPLIKVGPSPPRKQRCGRHLLFLLIPEALSSPHKLLSPLPRDSLRLFVTVLNSFEETPFHLLRPSILTPLAS